MSLYLLDSDTLTLYSGGHPRVCQRVLDCVITDLAISIICVEEALSGWYALLRKSKTDHQTVCAYRQMTQTMSMLKGFSILTFELGAANRFQSLRAAKIRIGTNDLRIACTALESGAIVITRNRSDFGQIPGLKIEDWSQP